MYMYIKVNQTAVYCYSNNKTTEYKAMCGMNHSCFSNQELEALQECRTTYSNIAPYA